MDLDNLRDDRNSEPVCVGDRLAFGLEAPWPSCPFLGPKKGFGDWVLATQGGMQKAGCNTTAAQLCFVFWSAETCDRARAYVCTVWAQIDPAS